MGCPQIQQGGSPLRMMARCLSRMVVLRMSPRFWWREVKWKVAFGVDLGQPFTVQIDYGFDRKGGIYEASL